MLDTAKALTNVASINVFTEGLGPVIVRSGMAQSLFIRLFQSDLVQRFVPATGATLSVKLPRAYSVGSSSATVPAADQSVTISATNPYSGDRSIWQIDLTLSQSNLVTGGGLILTLTEGATVTTFMVRDFVRKVLPSGC